MRVVRWRSSAEIPGFAAFERTFWYPFGERRFRIDHRKDSLRFFGPRAARFLAVADGLVVGTLAVSLRRGGAYLGDLKVAPKARGGTVLARLARAAMAEFPAVRAAYAVVMDGTETTPEAYTGRAGLPAMAPLARLAILRVEGAAPSAASFHGANVTDTRASKRLYWEDGTEMLNAHLARLASGTAGPDAGTIAAAAAHAARLGFPALLAAVPERDAAAVAGALAPLSVSSAGVTVYGFGFRDGYRWDIETAEV